MEVAIHIFGFIFFGGLAIFVLYYRKMLLDERCGLHKYFANKPSFYMFMKVFSPILIVAFSLKFLTSIAAALFLLLGN